MTSQAKNAAAKMKMAGLERSEYSVQTKKIWRSFEGKRFYEWGEAKIRLRCDRSRAIAMTPAMLQAGLHVTHYMVDGEVLVVFVDDEYGEGGRLDVVGRGLTSKGN